MVKKMNKIILSSKEFLTNIYKCMNCKNEYNELIKNCKVCGGRCQIQHIYACHVPHWGQHQIIVLEDIKDD